uniref:NIR n=1 Tax=Arundo donax TaxID=35708 RepID=A0A0A8Z806_ARUDO
MYARSLMCGCSYRSWEPITQTFHFLGRLVMVGFPWELLVM